MNMEEARNTALALIERQVKRGESLRSLFMRMVKARRMSPVRWTWLIIGLVYSDSFESDSQQASSHLDSTASKGIPTTEVQHGHEVQELPHQS